MMKIKNIISSINSEIFPEDYKCVICGDELSTNTLYAICEHCMDILPYNNGKTCLRCNEPINNLSNYCMYCKDELPLFKKNRSIFLYTDAISQLIRMFKYDNARYLKKTLGNFIASEVVKMEKNFDLVIPVPLHEDRYKLRGYNQSELLCEGLSNKLNLKVDSSALVKIRNTPSQANLTRNERKENVKDAFEVPDKSKVKGKIILLVDDVFTTGTTINECTRTLLDAGAKEVYSITLTHANTTKYFLQNM